MRKRCRPLLCALLICVTLLSARGADNSKASWMGDPDGPQRYSVLESISGDILLAQSQTPPPPPALVWRTEISMRPDISAFNFDSSASAPRAAILLAQVPSATDTGREVTPMDERIAQMGHSLHGPAFDEGPRQKPWKMEGIGHVHFPITTRNPEVQKWFDQGMTLLHLFWYFEAERAFRWCLKLDPDCAMAYWGLYLSCEPAWADDSERSREFLKGAWTRRHLVSERERLYIEAWEARSGAGLSMSEQDKKKRSGFKEFRRLLGELVERYPDDLDAKALLAIAAYQRDPKGERLLQEVLARNPDHPGAHHYRIHTWDSVNPALVLDSAERLRKVVPRAGHALHMPGHVYAALGMWHEGAACQDSATRVEKRNMQEHLVFPFNEWSYGHNRDFLCYFQEQLGRVNAALAGARELLSVPQDPALNSPADRGSTYRQGLCALMRIFARFERWDDLLQPGQIPWDLNPHFQLQKQYYETLAHLSRGDTDQASKSHAAFSSLLQAGIKDVGVDPRYTAFERLRSIQSKELHALMQLARGNTNEGFPELEAVAAEDRKFRKQNWDPPITGRVVYNVLGREYLKHGLPAEARIAFEGTLVTVTNDAMALAGLTRAYHALGEYGKAAEYLGRLRHVWSGADPGLPAMKELAALNLKATERPVAMAKETPYNPSKLGKLGPAYWEPALAPQLSAKDPAGRRVSLAEYRGRNVLLVFYLGEECPHCMAQLAAISKRHKEFSDLNTVVLAVSSNPPEQNAASLQTRRLPFRLLSDVEFANAKRFHSFDDFEESALHSTLLIDAEGKLRWGQNGGAPFMNLDYLLSEIKRVNELVKWRAVTTRSERVPVATGG